MLIHILINLFLIYLICRFFPKLYLIYYLHFNRSIRNVPKIPSFVNYPDSFALISHVNHHVIFYWLIFLIICCLMINTPDLGTVPVSLVVEDTNLDDIDVLREEFRRLFDAGKYNDKLSFRQVVNEVTKGSISEF